MTSQVANPIESRFKKQISDAAFQWLIECGPSGRQQVEYALYCVSVLCLGFCLLVHLPFAHPSELGCCLAQEIRGIEPNISGLMAQGVVRIELRGHTLLSLNQSNGTVVESSLPLIATADDQEHCGSPRDQQLSTSFLDTLNSKTEVLYYSSSKTVDFQDYQALQKLTRVSIKIGRKGRCFLQNLPFVARPSNSLQVALSMLHQLTGGGYILHPQSPVSYPVSIVSEDSRLGQHLRNTLVVLLKLLGFVMLLLGEHVVSFQAYSCAFNFYTCRRKRAMIPALLQSSLGIISITLGLYLGQRAIGLNLSPLVFALFTLHTILASLMHHVLFAKGESRRSYVVHYFLSFLVMAVYVGTYPVEDHLVPLLGFVCYSTAMMLTFINKLEIVEREREYLNARMFQESPNLLVILHRHMLEQELGVSLNPFQQSAVPYFRPPPDDSTSHPFSFRNSILAIQNSRRQAFGTF